MHMASKHIRGSQHHESWGKWEFIRQGETTPCSLERLKFKRLIGVGRGINNPFEKNWQFYIKLNRYSWLSNSTQELLPKTNGKHMSTRRFTQECSYQLYAA